MPRQAGTLKPEAGVMLKFDENLSKMLREAANEERRSVTGYIRVLVEQKLLERQSAKEPVKR